MDKCIIGKRIKETRMVRNMTREKLAAESGEAIVNNKLLYVQMLLAEALNDIKGLINT